MSETPKRLLHNIDAEQALIGAVLVNNDVFDAAKVKPEHFYDPVHAMLWSVITHRIEKGLQCSPVLLKPAVDGHEGMKSLGGVSYLATLAGASVSIRSAPDYANQIRDLAGQRAVYAALDRAKAALVEQSPADVVAARLEEEMAAIHDFSRTEASAMSAKAAAVMMLEKANEAYQAGGLAGLSTGIDELDDLTGGLVDTEIWVIGARSSMGKTAVALHIARSVASSGVGVMFHSLEMSPPALMQRVASSKADEDGCRITYLDIRTGNQSEHQMRALVDATRKIAELPMIITQPSTRSIGGISAETRAAARSFKAKGTPLGLIIVDYVQKIEGNGEGGYERITAAISAMDRLAKDHNCPIIVLAQLNREVENRANQGKGSIPRPQMSDLKGSGSIEEDADVILLLHRDEYYLERMKPSTSEAIAKVAELKERAKGKMDIFVEKFRTGARREITVNADLPVNRVIPTGTKRTPDQDGFDL